jgi:hypothetical protein
MEHRGRRNRHIRAESGSAPTSTREVQPARIAAAAELIQAVPAPHRGALGRGRLHPALCRSGPAEPCHQFQLPLGHCGALHPRRERPGRGVDPFADAAGDGHRNHTGDPAFLHARVRQPDPALSSWSWVWFFRGTPVYTQLIFWGLVTVLYPSISLGIPFGPELVHVVVSDPTKGLIPAVLCHPRRSRAHRSHVVHGEPVQPLGALGQALLPPMNVACMFDGKSATARMPSRKHC